MKTRFQACTGDGNIHECSINRLKVVKYAEKLALAIAKNGRHDEIYISNDTSGYCPVCKVEHK